MANNILLISENNEVNENLLKKLVLLRENDKITICTYKDIKNLSKSDSKLAILYSFQGNENETIKHIENIKNELPEIEILLYVDKIEPEFLYQAYDAGIYDCFSVDDDNYVITIKIMNCLKFIAQKQVISRHSQYLSVSGALDSKTGMYKPAYLKEVFPYLTEIPKYRNGIMALITLDETVKTKVSINRLAILINKSLRQNDIAIVEKNGHFYLIFEDINIENAKKIVEKLQNSIGNELKIHAGLSKIGFDKYNEVVKNCKDSLNKAILNDELCSTFSIFDDNWVENDKNSQKTYKIFQNLFKNKLKYVIEPVFFKFQNDCSKLKNTVVNQYSNTVESVFCLKNDNVRSELVLRFDGFSKIKAEIAHSGLESPEDKSFEIPMKNFTSRELTKLLKQLKDEFLSVK